MRHSRASLRCILLCLSMAAGPLAAAPAVVASIAPLHSLVAAVMEGVGSPHLLLRGGESPHTFSLRPSDARLLQQAELIFWVGPALEMPLARILPGVRGGQAIAMQDLAGMELLPARHLDELGGTPHQDSHSDHGHAGAIDPHLWLSPANAAVMTDAIERALVAVDPAHAVAYRDNAARLRMRLQQLDDELRTQLAALHGGYVVFHDAYQYLERRYGLQPIGAITLDAGRSPGAAHLSALRERIRREQVACVFSEPQYSQRLLNVLDDGIPLRHAVLDPLGADIVPGPDAYLQTLGAMGRNLAACLGQEVRP